jgi:hypothetical protein
MEQIKPDSIDMLLKNAISIMDKAIPNYYRSECRLSLYEAMNLVIALDADDRQREAFFEEEKYDENAVLPVLDSDEISQLSRSRFRVDGSRFENLNPPVPVPGVQSYLIPETPIEGKAVKSIKIPGYDKWIDLVGMSDEDEKALLNYLGGATISDPSSVAMVSEIKVDDTTTPTSDDTGKEKKSPCGAKYLPL